jgi:hypothetical protein
MKARNDMRKQERNPGLGNVEVQAMVYNGCAPRFIPTILNLILGGA